MFKRDHANHEEALEVLSESALEEVTGGLLFVTLSPSLCYNAGGNFYGLSFGDGGLNSGIGVCSVKDL
jgi:hypothetical protein